MRPSSPSSSDPNAPYRAAITSLVDCNFFTDVHAEQPDTHSAASQHSPFAELSPRRGSLSNLPSAITDAGPSSASQVTIGTVLEYLSERGRGCQLVYGTINNRLNSANLSAETMLTALQISHTENHPLLTSLGVNPYERSELINRLDGIVNIKSGFRQEIKTAVQNSNDDPGQVITNLLQLIRLIRSRKRNR